MEGAKGQLEGSATDRDAWREPFRAPMISLPKGGGAIRGLGEKFSANPVTGTGSMSVPIATSRGRAGFGPQLSISYDSGAGNGAFGFGWNLALPSITRKTDKGLPQYRDTEHSDTFILSGAEDLVPVGDGDSRTVGGTIYRVRRYRPRIEGLFALIERWMHPTSAAETFWRSISRDNVTTWYGKSEESRIFDPVDPSRIFSWLICQSHDDKGNVIVYRYQAEDGENVELSRAHERNRGARADKLRSANRYLKRICYGNRDPYLPELKVAEPWPEPPATEDVLAVQYSSRWMFEVVFDYDQDHVTPQTPTAAGIERVAANVVPAKAWPVRNDPFSSYRSGFEVRTYRLCRRALMFHHFPDEADVKADCLVRSTEFIYSDQQNPGDAANAVFSFLCSVSQSGYKRDGANHLKRSLPPVDFEYTQPRIDPRVHELTPESLENLPAGLDGSEYQWVDLESEGLSGILTEQAEGWFYKRNLSPINLIREGDVDRAQATLAPVELVATRPAASIAGGNAQFMDLAGDGQLDLVMFDEPTPGFYEHDGQVSWEPFRAFLARLNRSTRDPNLRFVDLDGDGHADVLITEDDAFTWHPSLGEEGFGPAERITKERDEERGPALVFADGTQSIYLADMSGDGLTDLVRIRNGEVCYWPNLGYGRFGARVTMDDAPWFDAPDQFDQRRLHLADVDGSGVTDIVYLRGDGVRIYFNQSGNGWQAATPLAGFPEVHNAASVTAVDLLGNGTACLVWSSPLPNDARRCMRYIDLMGGQKPHLLVKTRNNLGAETEIQYAPSTKFYLQDKMAGRPWITRLPFPVHVVERTILKDKWRNTEFACTYSYHHGYFDGVEREFRGFGRVEQTDVENFHKFAAGNKASPYITDDQTLYQPPVKTITWFHTGAALDRERILSQFEQEYFPNSLAARPASVQLDNVFAEKALPEPVLESLDLNPEEWREALRACKGMTLRQEVYELAVDPLQPAVGKLPQEVPVRLFSAANHNCGIRCLQRQGDNRHAVFLVTESEAASYQYELDLRGAQPLKPDPRVAHTLNLLFDDFGNAQQSVTVGYPRWRQFDDPHLVEHADLIREVQLEHHVAYTETHYTLDAIDKTPAPAPIQYYRLPMPCEVQTYELTGFTPAQGKYFELADFRKYKLSETLQPQGNALVVRKPYHQLPQDMAATLRLVEHGRSLFFKDDLSGRLDLGELGRLGIRYEQYKLALTDDLLDAIFTGGELDDLAPDGQAVRDLLRQPLVCGYTSGDTFFSAGTAPPDAAQDYWMRSGIAGFAANAAARFYLPERYSDPFGKVTEIEFDRYSLLLQSSTDALGNTGGVYVDPDPTVGARIDYRLLAPAEAVDISGNRTELYFDVLGLVVASVAKGKGTEGDDLVGFTDAVANPGLTTTLGFFDLPPLTAAAARNRYQPAILNAGNRFIYHFGEQLDNGKIKWGERPAGSCGVVREVHAAALSTANQPGPLQIGFECSDGMGAVLMKRGQAEPAQDGGNLRWIVSGKTVVNNKGKPVKQYEPYFTEKTSCCAEGDENEAVGVTALMYYDAAGRLIRTEMPDGTLSRVEFSPWFSRSFDQNDMVKESSWFRRRLTTLERGANAPAATAAEEAAAQAASSAEKRAARLAADHAGTPSESHFDSLGRAVVAIAHNRVDDGAGGLTDERYMTFTRMDSEGKTLWIRDAVGNLVMQYVSPPKANRDIPRVARGFGPGGNPDNDIGARTPTYDIAGNQLFQHGMDGGDRWLVTDAAGKPMFAWDRNQRQDHSAVEDRFFFTKYDKLHRPLEQWLSVDAGAARMLERFEYQDAQVNDSNNLNGQAVRHYDPSGRTEVVQRDFNGNVLEVKRRLNDQPTESAIDWQSNPENSLNAEVFTQITEFDALNRMKRQYNWHRAAPDNRVAVYAPEYNERGLLSNESFTVRARKTPNGAALVADSVESQPIKKVRYNAKGQRELLLRGNGTTTQFEYDENTNHLMQLRTTRPAYDPPFPNYRGDLQDGKLLQQLSYTYDPVGNTAEIYDEAYRPAFFQNAIIEPQSLYEYDALYRLVSATGREDGAATGAPPQLETRPADVTFPVTAAGAMRKYTQTYRYDPVGNLRLMGHDGGANGSWTRRYAYAFDDAAQPASNRLWRTWQGDPSWTSGNATNKVVHLHDIHGNISNLAQVAATEYLKWDHRDMIAGLKLGGGGDAYYQYDSGKQRIRKRIVDQNGLGGYWERIYLSGYELYRRYTAAGATVPVEEIDSHHLFEGDQRVLLIDDVVKSSKGTASARPDGLTVKPQIFFRYQYGNHLGSMSLELDDLADIVSYEEFHPYGTSAHRAVKGEIEAPSKRYRYTGMERDEESGLGYHGARFLSPWLARWTSADPTGVSGGSNLYQYANANPVRFIDPLGKQGVASLLQHEEQEFTKAYQNQHLPFVSRQIMGDFAQASFILGKVWSGFNFLSGNAIESIDTVHDREASGDARYGGEYGTANYITDLSWEIGVFAAKSVVQLVSGRVVDKLIPAAPLDAGGLTRLLVQGERAGAGSAFKLLSNAGIDSLAGRGNFSLSGSALSVGKSTAWSMGFSLLGSLAGIDTPGSGNVTQLDPSTGDFGPAPEPEPAGSAGAAPDYATPRTADDAGYTPTGGAYRAIRDAWKGGEVNHMPSSWSVSYSNLGLSRDAAPAILMDPEDHAKTATWGSWSSSVLSRFFELEWFKDPGSGFAMSQDAAIDEIREMFGSKYDHAIFEMLEYSRKIGLRF
jgi:RHS repeat-associated protein